MHLGDPLKPVLTPTGETSPLYPQNVQILLNYDRTCIVVQRCHFSLELKSESH